MELRWPPRDPADGPDEPRLDGSPPSHKVIVAGTRIEVERVDGGTDVIEGDRLDRETSRSLIQRDGTIARIRITLGG